jgi:hypothetical protein
MRIRQNLAVDAYGNELLCTANAGWTRAHNAVLDVFERIATNAGIVYDVEPFAEFITLIQQHQPAGAPGIARADARRIRSGIVPDFKYVGADGREVLADLKRVYPGERYRKRHATTEPGSVVAQRQTEVNNDYQKHARKIDVDYNGCGAQQIGPVRAHLDSFGAVNGWVFGSYGEVSAHVRQFVLYAAKKAAADKWELMGHLSEVHSCGRFKAMYRKWLSVVAWRSLAQLKLNTLGRVCMANAGLADWRRKERHRVSRAVQREMFLRKGPGAFADGRRRAVRGRGWW